MPLIAPIKIEGKEYTYSWSFSPYHGMTRNRNAPKYRGHVSRITTNVCWKPKYITHIPWHVWLSYDTLEEDLIHHYTAQLKN